MLGTRGFGDLLAHHLTHERDRDPAETMDDLLGAADPRAGEHRPLGHHSVRLALGADPGHVAGMIVRQGGLVAIAGVIVGLGVAYAGSRFIASLLYGVSARDPAVFAATTVLLLTVA